jgi:hypothetical protein
VFADDRLIDRIADSPWGPAARTSSTGAHRRADGAQPAHNDLATADPLVELFETWRDELAADPMPALPKLGPALVPAPAPKPAQRRSLRPALSVAAAIAALLVGTATIGSKNADPESALWRITQVMWPERVQSVASASKVSVALEEARTAIQAGRSRDAQLALLRATVELGNVDPVDGLDDMQQQVQELWVVASPQPKSASSTPDGSSASTTPGPTVDLSTLFGSTPPSTLAPVPLVPATTSDPAVADLAGTVGAPAPTPAAAAPPALPLVLGDSASPSIVVPPLAGPSTDAPAPPSSTPAPVTDAPATDVAPSDETTSVPPPAPVESTAPEPPPASQEQSAPEQSPPAPTPLVQSPEPDPTVDPGTSAAADSALSTDPTLVTGP